MRRFVILIGGVAFVLFIIFPYISGIIIQNKLNEALINTDKITDKKNSFTDIDFSRISIKRGWFTSKAYIGGKIYPKKTKGIILSGIASGFRQAGNEFNIEIDIWHGPLLFIYRSKSKNAVGLAALSSKINLDFESSKNKIESLPIRLDSYISYAGDFIHTLLLPAHKQRVNKLLYFNFLDLDFEFYHTADFSQYKFNLDVDEFNINHLILGKIVVKDINVNERYFMEDKSYDFSRIILADEISLKTIDGKKVSIDEFLQEITILNSPQDIADIKFLMSINNLNGMFGEYKKFSININGDDFYLKPLVTFFEKISNGDASFSSGDFFGDIGKSITDKSVVKVTPIKFSSVEGGLEINGNINPKYPWPENLKSVKTLWELANKIKFNVSISEKLAQEITRYFMILDKRRELLKVADHNNSKEYLRAQNIKIDDDKVKSQIQDWEKAGLISLDKQKYNIDFKFSDGVFNVNGNVL